MRHGPVSPTPWPAALGAALALALVPAAAQAAAFTGRVVRVIDGDTLVVRDDAAVRRETRIAGIDAPEIRQPYGVRARSRLVEIAYAKRVRVVWYKRDAYGRRVGRVFVESGSPCTRPPCAPPLDAGWAQIVAGYAWHDREHATEQALDERMRYALAERAARSRGDGLWADAHPMPPWRYRHLHPRRLPPRPRWRHG